MNERKPKLLSMRLWFGEDCLDSSENKTLHCGAFGGCPFLQLPVFRIRDVDRDFHSVDIDILAKDWVGRALSDRTSGAEAPFSAVLRHG